MNEYTRDEQKSKEKHLKLTKLKMDYNILKTSKKDVFDYWKGIPHNTWGQIHCNMLPKELSEIESKLEFIDREIKSNFKKMPIHLDTIDEFSLERRYHESIYINSHRS